MLSAAHSVALPESQQEAAAVLAAAGAAQSARQAQISAEIARYKAQIATLEATFAERSRQYPSGDSGKRETAEER